MADLLFAMVTIASFAVLIAFVYACAKLLGSARGVIQEGSLMNIEYLLGGLVALGIGIYLTIALLRPDAF